MHSPAQDEAASNAFCRFAWRRGATPVSLLAEHGRDDSMPPGHTRSGLRFALTTRAALKKSGAAGLSPWLAQAIATGRGPMSYPPSGGARCRVLVIDDDPDVRLSLQILLDTHGHAVELAADGAEGIAKALAKHPEVVVIDLNLPLISGYEVARRVRAGLGNEVLLIAYSVYSVSVRGRVRESGFDAHFVKGDDPGELVYLLDSGSREAASRSALAVGLGQCKCGKDARGSAPKRGRGR
jgi:CheY-like chemotaxis protein